MTESGSWNSVGAGAGELCRGRAECEGRALGALRNGGGLDPSAKECAAKMATPGFSVPWCLLDPGTGPG